MFRPRDCVVMRVIICCTYAAQGGSSLCSIEGSSNGMCRTVSLFLAAFSEEQRDSVMPSTSYVICKMSTIYSSGFYHFMTLISSAVRTNRSSTFESSRRNTSKCSLLRGNFRVHTGSGETVPEPSSNVFPLGTSPFS